MPMTPPPGGWTMNDPESRRRFEDWLRREERSAMIRTACLVIGILLLGVLLWLMMIASPALAAPISKPTLPIEAIRRHTYAERKAYAEALERKVRELQRKLRERSRD